MVMLIDPILLNKYTKEELVNYIVMSQMPRKCRELYNIVKDGVYVTRYDLCKFYTPGTVGHFIKLGLAYGYIKRDWKFTGTRKKGILRAAMPSEVLLNKANTKVEPISTR